MTDSDDVQTGELENLRPNAADDIYNTLKIALAAGAGYVTGDPTGVVAATLGSIFSPPIQKRRDKLLLELAKGFVALEEKIASFSIVGLIKDEPFITVLTHAVQAAMRDVSVFLCVRHTMVTQRSRYAETQHPCSQARYQA